MRIDNQGHLIKKGIHLDFKISKIERRIELKIHLFAFSYYICSFLWFLLIRWWGAKIAVQRRNEKILYKIIKRLQLNLIGINI